MKRRSIVDIDEVIVAEEARKADVERRLGRVVLKTMTGVRMYEQDSGDGLIYEIRFRSWNNDGDGTGESIGHVSSADRPTTSAELNALFKRMVEQNKVAERKHNRELGGAVVEIVLNRRFSVKQGAFWIDSIRPDLTGGWHVSISRQPDYSRAAWFPITDAERARGMPAREIMRRYHDVRKAERSARRAAQ